MLKEKVDAVHPEWMMSPHQCIPISDNWIWPIATHPFLLSLLAQHLVCSVASVSHSNSNTHTKHTNTLIRHPRPHTHTHTLSLSLPFCLSFFRSSPGSLLCATCTAHSHHALCCRSDLGKQVCIIFHATCHQGTWAWNGCALVCVKKRNEPSVFHQRLSSFRLTVQLLCCFHALISCRHQDGENCCTVWIPLVSCHLCLADENPPWRHTHTHKHVSNTHACCSFTHSQRLYKASFCFRSFVLSFFRSFVLSFFRSHT